MESQEEHTGDARGGGEGNTEGIWYLATTQTMSLTPTDAKRPTHTHSRDAGTRWLHLTLVTRLVFIASVKTVRF